MICTSFVVNCNANGGYIGILRYRSVFENRLKNVFPKIIRTLSCRELQEVQGFEKLTKNCIFETTRHIDMISTPPCRESQPEHGGHICLYRSRAVFEKLTKTVFQKLLVQLTWLSWDHFVEKCNTNTVVILVFILYPKLLVQMAWFTWK